MNSYHRDGKAINPQLLVLFLCLSFCYLLPLFSGLDLTGSRWRACVIFPLCVQLRHCMCVCVCVCACARRADCPNRQMFMIRGKINIGLQKNVKTRKRQKVKKAMGGDETEERNIFKLFLNPSVSLPCCLLDSPVQPTVVHSAEMQYGCCVRCRCCCMCVYESTCGGVQVCQPIV